MKKSIYFLIAMIWPLMLSAQWEQIYTASDVYMLNSIKFFDEQSGVLLAEDAYINMTADGGQTWNILTHPQQYASPSDFFKFGASKYVVFSDLWPSSSLMVTLNAGEWWYDVSPDITQPQAVDFLNINLGYCAALGMEGSTIGNAIYRLESIGPYQVPEEVYFTDQEGYFDHILCLDDEVVLASFEISDNNPTIPQYTGILLRSDDQGGTWTQVLQMSDNKMFYKIDLSMDGTCIYAHTWGEMFYSMDEGLTWGNQEIPLEAVDLLSRQEAYGVVITSGFGSMIDTFNLVYTSDSWQNWTAQLKIPFAPYIIDRSVHLQMISENTGYFAYFNQLYKTTNGGWVGLNENAHPAQSDLYITPNPASESFRIDLPDDIERTRKITIIDSRGAMVFTSEIEKHRSFMQIDCKLWNPGIYFISVESGLGKPARKKLVIH